MTPALRRRIALVGAALALLGAACWNPTVTLDRPAVNAIVVLDITQSMDVPDMRLDGHAATRIELARAALRNALGALPCGARLGLGIFSEYRILLLTAPAEVCAGHAELTALVGRLDNRLAWTNASEVRKGVLNAREAALALPGKPALVFITDGHEAPPLGPGQGRHFDGRPDELRGLLLGVGGDLPQPIPKHDKLGRALGYWSEGEVVQRRAPADSPPDATASGEQLSALHEEQLARLAHEIGFGYSRLDRPEALAFALSDSALTIPAPAAIETGDAFSFAALIALLLSFYNTKLVHRRG